MLHSSMLSLQTALSVPSFVRRDGRMRFAARDPKSAAAVDRFTPDKPLVARVLSRVPLTEPNAYGQAYHLTLDVAGCGFAFRPGQCLGILPVGAPERDVAMQPKPYSIASSPKGDDGQGRTLSICVKPRVYTDPVSGRLLPGGLSSDLSRLQPGDTVRVTGPLPQAFPLPTDPKTNVILIATGTGIAPFRSFLQARYANPFRRTGQTWLIYGVKSQADHLYKQEMDRLRRHKSFRMVPAYSREMSNPQGGRMYVQDQVLRHGDELLKLLQKSDTAVYFCGLKAMVPGILQSLQASAERHGVDWEKLLADLKAQNRWHVAVY